MKIVGVKKRPAKPVRQRLPTVLLPQPETPMMMTITISPVSPFPLFHVTRFTLGSAMCSILWPPKLLRIMASSRSV
jgi:hypothetical protein